MAAVNVPLLRKAVEWAEAEAAKPEGEFREWVLPDRYRAPIPAAYVRPGDVLTVETADGASVDLIVEGVFWGVVYNHLLFSGRRVDDRDARVSTEIPKDALVAVRPL